MRDLQFDWDPKKDAANQRKHGVSFQEASTVFSDEHALLIDDPDHSEEEERFILLGLSAGLRTLVVCHCYREAQDVIRLDVTSTSFANGTTVAGATIFFDGSDIGLSQTSEIVDAIALPTAMMVN